MSRNSWSFYAAFAGTWLAALSSCSSGKTGLVLGSAEPQFQTGGSSSAGAAPLGGELAVSGGEASAAEAGAETGAAGSAPLPAEPPWIAETCTPTIKFENRDTTAQGQLFTDAVPDPSVVLWAAAHAACRVLFRSASEVKPIPEISLLVDDVSGIASTAGTTLRLSTGYLQSEADRGVDLRQEITGVLHFATSLVYQNSGANMDPAIPKWLIVGMADYVRLEAGYIALTDKAKGGSYDTSSKATAFFLEYLATRNPDIVYQLNQRLSPSSPAWSNDVFASLTGRSLDALWTDYQASF